MSGIEILAIAASVLQIADLGARLSVKLFTYSRKIKNADKHIDSISHDIAGTGAVLQLLGKELEKDESLRLCSDEAIAQARRLMDDCRKIFEDLNDAIDGNHKTGSPGSKLIFGLKQRLKYPFLEPQIDLLRAKLEKLKADLMVMLNVLIYGGQLRSHEALPVLKDQQELLKSLIEERMQSQKQLDLVMKRLDHLVVAESSSASILSRETFDNTSSSMTLINSGSSGQGPPPPPTPDHRPPSLPMCLHDRADEVFDHCRLVSAIIDEVNHAQYKLNAGIRYRAQEKILESHYDEWSDEWQHHAGTLQHRYDYFEKHHHLKTYWKVKDSQNKRQNPTQRSSDYTLPQTSSYQTALKTLHIETPAASMSQQQAMMPPASMSQQQVMMPRRLPLSHPGTAQQQQQQSPAMAVLNQPIPAKESPTSPQPPVFVQTGFSQEPRTSATDESRPGSRDRARSDSVDPNREGLDGLHGLGSERSRRIMGNTTADLEDLIDYSDEELQAYPPKRSSPMTSGSGQEQLPIAEPARPTPGLVSDHESKKRKFSHDDSSVRLAVGTAYKADRERRQGLLADRLRAFMQDYTSIPKAELDRSLAMVDSLPGYP